MTPAFNLRSASADDQTAIKRLVRRAKIAPFSLHWSHFTIAVDKNGGIIGCGQLKHHNDGSVELASLVVKERWRKKGVARALIESLIDSHKGGLWLLCRSNLTPLYKRFGFVKVGSDKARSRYFRRLQILIGIIRRTMRPKEYPVIMYLGQYTAGMNTHIGSSKRAG